MRAPCRALIPSEVGIEVVIAIVMIKVNTIFVVGFSRRILAGLTLVITLLLAACGGGGGGGGNSSPPVANSEVLYTLKGRPVSATLNATDTDNDTLTFSIVDNGQLGTAVITNVNTGEYTYTPNAGVSGTDTFTFKANDGAHSDMAVVTVHIQDGQPEANDDTYSVNEGSILNIGAAAGVLANDLDAENDPLTVTLVNNVSNGSLTLNSDGSFTYTHNGSETTSDSFTYKANDGTYDSYIATVTITINPVNDPPVANSDSYTVDEGSSLFINNMLGVLANDTDVDSAGLIAGLIGNVSHGALTLNSDGSFTYVHDGSETTSDSFTYKTNDGTYDSNTATVSITVNPVNDPPVANSDSYSVDEGSSLVISKALGVLANDTDADSASLIAGLVGDVSHGTLTLNTDGSFTYIHDGSETTSDSFTYKANDGSVNSSQTTVTIIINPINDPPVAGDDSGATDEDTVLNVAADGVLANDSDADMDTLTITGFDAVSSYGAAVNVNADGSYSYDPTSAADLQMLSGGELTTDSFTYTISDGIDSATATVTITVSGVNDAPTAGGSCGTTPQEQNYSGTLDGGDVETPGLLTFSLGADGSGGAGPVATTNSFIV
jgi:VCBS repeat-containing protein